MTDYAGFARFYDRIVGDRSEEIERLQSYIAAFRPAGAAFASATREALMRAIGLLCVAAAACIVQS